MKNNVVLSAPTLLRYQGFEYYSLGSRAVGLRQSRALNTPAEKLGASRKNKILRFSGKVLRGF